MSALDPYYLRLLHIGFSVLRQAVDASDAAWIDAELEFLHNIPSLIGEQNIERHKYFWLQERQHYVAWITSAGSGLARSRLNTFYMPILQEMTTAVENCLRIG